MRVRATTLAIAVAATLLAPLTTAAEAVTTTSTVIAFSADPNGDGFSEIYTRPADGSGTPTLLIAVPSRDVWTPTLSPDGTKIAYLQKTIAEESRLYVRNVNGTGSPVLLSDTDVISAPNWSADGTKVAFTWIDWDVFEGGSYWVPATGGTPTLIPKTDEDIAGEPSFSPSGRQVAVVGFTDEGDVAGIDMVTLSTGTRARIKGTEGGEDPQWSPDGRYILFQKGTACGYSLYRVPAGGGTPTPFRVVANRFLGAAEYSRDGSQVFWTQTTFGCTSFRAGELYVANADGSNPQPVASTPDVYEFHSSVAGGTPLVDTTAPAAPVINAVGTVGATTATISWTAEEDATEFVVLRKDSGEAAPTSITDGALVYHGAARSATATGLVTGTTYDFYVYAIDSSGNEGPVSAVHSAKPTPVPVLAAIPRVGVADPTALVSASWSSAATTFDVAVGERRKNSAGVWSSAATYTVKATGTAEKSYSFTGAQARTYFVKVRAHDGLGNVTAYTAPKSAHVPLNENWSGFAYSAGWTGVASATRYLGTYKYSLGADKSVSAKLDTSSFTVIGDKCSSCGAFKVYVDGVHKATIDTYSSTTKTRQVLYAGGNFGTIKGRTIKIVSVGTAGRSRVDLDGIALTR